ncbi:MAG: hypothetical protein ACUVTB_06410 [Candidatus Bathycorpusculaceae bacterium]
MMIEIAFLALIALCVLNWSKGYYIKSIDSIFALNPNFLYSTSSFIWKDYYSFGLCSADFGLHSFYALQSFLTDFLGLVNSQIVIIYIGLISAEIGMYFLLREFFKNNNAENMLCRVSGSLFYVFNPFTLSWIFWRFMVYSLFYVLLPFALFFLYKTIVADKWKIFLAGYASYVLFVLSAAINLTTLSNYILSMGFIYVLAHYKSLKMPISKMLFKYLFLLFLTMLLLFWVLFPQYMTVEETIKGVESLSIQDARYFLHAASRHTTILNTMRLLGTYLLYESYMGNYYYSWLPQFLLSRSSILVSILLPLFIFMPLLFLKSLDKQKRFLLIVSALCALLVIFLMKGSALPFGEINELFVYIHPTFFRHPYERFAILLSFFYTFMFSMAVYTAIKLFGNKRICGFFVVFLFFTLFFGLYMQPFFTGDVIFNGSQVIPSDRVAIPSYYHQLNQEFEDSFKRILVFPISYWGEASYEWDSGYHPNADPPLAYFISNSSIVQFNSGKESDRLLSLVYELLSKGEIELFWKLMNVSSIRYIVIHGDWDGRASIIKTFPIETWRSILNQPETEPLIMSDEGEITTLNFSSANLSGEKYELSFSFLYKKPEKLTGLYPPLISMGYEKPMDNGVVLCLELPSQALVFGFKDIQGVWYQLKYPLVNILPNLWINITGKITKETSSTHLELFINGIKTNEMFVTATPNFTVNKIFIGFGGNEHLNEGEIADLRVNICDEKLTLRRDTLSLQHKYPIDEIKDVGKLTIIKLKDPLPLVHVNRDLTSNLSIEINETSLRNISLEFEKVDFLRVNPTLWRIKANRTEPFILSFAESFDSQWKAKVYRNGKLLETVNSTPLYGVFNGFWINQTGELDIVIEYEPQRWFFYGSIISLSTFLICTAYLTYTYTKPKRLLHNPSY